MTDNEMASPKIPESLHQEQARAAKKQTVDRKQKSRAGKLGWQARLKKHREKELAKMTSEQRAADAQKNKEAYEQALATPAPPVPQPAPFSPFSTQKPT